MTSKGTRSSGAEGTPKSAPDWKSAHPKRFKPEAFGNENIGRRKLSNLRQEGNEVVTEQSG